MHFGKILEIAIAIFHEVWYNIDIKVDRKCIFYKIWYDKGLRYIHDFLNDEKR